MNLCGFPARIHAEADQFVGHAGADASDAPGLASGGMSHRPRFSEWQHPDVKAFLRADASR